MLTLRRALAPEDVAVRSARVLRRLAEVPQFRNAARIGLYLPLWNEVDVTPLLDSAGSGPAPFLPRLLPDGTLEFAAYDPARIGAGPRGVRQPEPDVPAIPMDELDAVLVPGLAFDRTRNRLGLGAGYYDKTLADCRRKPFTIGIAYAFQLVDALPTDPWDVPLDCVVSETVTI